MGCKGQCQTADGQRLYALTAIGAGSRHVLAWARCRLLERLRSDYGSPVASARADRLSKLAVLWLILGIALEPVQGGNRQQNGRHERISRVLKAVTVRPPAATRREQ